MQQKKKERNRDFIKITNFWAANNTTENMKQPTEWQKIFANHVSESDF